MEFVQMNSIDATEFGLIFDSTVVGLTVLWLIAKSLARFRGFFRFLLSLSVLLIIAVISILSYSTEDFELFAASFVFIALIILIPMVIARKVCGKSCTPVRFIMSLALWTIISSMFAIIGFIIIASISTSSGLIDVTFETTFIFTLAGMVFALFIYVINLSYVILGYTNPFFRERFFACLNFDIKCINASSYI